MDAVTLTTQVMNALTPIMPYLQSAGVAISAKIGEDVYAQGKKLYEAIRARFAGEPDNKALMALQAYVEDPADMAGGVEIKLQRLIQADPAFAQALAQILQSGPRISIQASDEAVVRANAMRISQEHGLEEIIASDRARVEENEMNISYE